MSVHVRIGAVGALLLGSMLMFGCAPKEEVPIEEVPTLDKAEVTFDGENCSFDGPGIIREGKVIIVLNNLTETPVHLEIIKLDEGKTWQDVLDLFNEPGVSFGRPREWSTITKNIVVIDDPTAREYIFDPGLHAISCLQVLETRIGIWTGAPLEVRAASSD